MCGPQGLVARLASGDVIESIAVRSQASVRGRGLWVVGDLAHRRRHSPKWVSATFLDALRNDRIEAPCLFDDPINGERFSRRRRVVRGRDPQAQRHRRPTISVPTKARRCEKPARLRARLLSLPITRQISTRSRRSSPSLRAQDSPPGQCANSGSSRRLSRQRLLRISPSRSMITLATTRPE